MNLLVEEVKALKQDLAVERERGEKKAEHDKACFDMAISQRDAAIKRAERARSDADAARDDDCGLCSAEHQYQEAEARAETAEAWQRAVANELGWSEEVDGAIPDAEFMASVARVHGKSHMRLEAAEAANATANSMLREAEGFVELVSWNASGSTRIDAKEFLEKLRKRRAT